MDGPRAGVPRTDRRGRSLVQLAIALQEIAALKSNSGEDPAEAIELADRALAVAAALDLHAPGARAWRGFARCKAGDRGGLEDYERAIERARSLGSAHTMLFHQGNYAGVLGEWSGPRDALAAFRENADLAERAGMELMAFESGSNVASCLAELGDWDAALGEIARLLPVATGSDSRRHVALLESLSTSLLSERGVCDGLAEVADSLVSVARRGLFQPGLIVVLYACAARALAALGRPAEARSLLEESLGVDSWLEFSDVSVVRTALSCGDVELAERLCARFAPLSPLREHTIASAHALLSEAHRDLEIAADGFADAATRWRGFGVPFEEAQALLGEGRCLTQLGRARDATPVLEQARGIFSRLGARPALAEVTGLMAQAGGPSDGSAE